ncbi:calcyphosin-2 isoform X2 [Scleropages formosus]|nr:calcyphosin-2 isoform X2 [Scleropages formosus]
MDLNLHEVSVTSRAQEPCETRGEKPWNKGWTGGSGVSHLRPKEVPALKLGELFDSDEEDATCIPFSEKPVHVGPPDSSSSMSWGTALSAQPSQCAVDKDAWTTEDAKSHLLQYYMGSPCTAQDSLKKLEAEDVAMEKRKQAVVHQVMVDQLSRAVISDPSQNSSLLEQNSFSTAGSVPLSFMKRTLHETKVKTSSSLTENLLSNKLRFDARILSRNGRNACRELIGFFFTYDNTLTVYEYRCFGKNRTNALPFIPKGCYRHQCGRRSGLQYSIHDFFVGANLSFSTHDQNLPESMKRNPLLWLRITDVDELAKSKLLSSSEDLKMCFSKEELDDRNTLLAIQATLQERVKKRAVCTIARLGRLLRRADGSGNDTLGKADVRRALEDHQLGLSEQSFQSIWRVLDWDGDDRVDCGELMRGLFGEMNEYRKAFVLKAYRKLDPTKSGSVSMTDIEKFSCARSHLTAVPGEATKEELRVRFLESLHSACSDAAVISFCEFEDFYEGMSIGIPDDQDFANILKNSWGI